jgi:K+-transporting ATPase ATPase C chain
MKPLLVAVRMLAVLTVLCGIAYPLAITAVAQAVFPRRASGSLVLRDGEVVGSALIGQRIGDPALFWGRPSAAGDGYDATASSGDNLGPRSPELVIVVRDRVAALRAADPGNTAPVPIDLVTTSASGLDPDISPEAAAYQIPRIARLRGISAEALTALVARHVARPLWGCFGAPHVNVLALDLELDHLAARAPERR